MVNFNFYPLFATHELPIPKPQLENIGSLRELSMYFENLRVPALELVDEPV
jgi:hypothetical protein